jgi:hypothetical protein
MSHIVMVKAVAYGVVTVRCFLRSSVAYLEEAKLLLITRSCCSALVRMIALREEAARVKCHRGLMFRAWRLSFGAARMRDRRIAAKVFERPDFATSFGLYVVLGGRAGGRAGRLVRASCAAGKETTVCSFFIQNLAISRPRSFSSS